MKQMINNIRNYTALIYTWLVLVWLVGTLFHGIAVINIATLLQLLFLSFAGAFLQQLFFAGKLFVKWSFTPKLTAFLVCLVLLESMLITAFGLFRITTFAGWLLFVGIAACMYLASIGIFHLYSKRAEKRYTRFLKDYQNSIEQE